MTEDEQGEAELDAHYQKHLAAVNQSLAQSTDIVRAYVKAVRALMDEDNISPARAFFDLSLMVKEENADNIQLISAFSAAVMLLVEQEKP